MILREGRCDGWMLFGVPFGKEPVQVSCDAVATFG
jgi:hypothetical protein